jgi:hypothetical protein
MNDKNQRKTPAKLLFILKLNALKIHIMTNYPIILIHQ